VYYGGSPENVHARNVEAAAPVTMHIGGGIEAINVEGTATIEKPTVAQAGEFGHASFAKYLQYGRMDPMYEAVCWCSARRSARVTDFGLDAMRFRFA
jgi:hypothetical protein